MIKRLFADRWRNLTILACFAWAPMAFLVPGLPKPTQFGVGLALGLVALVFFAQQLFSTNPLPLQRRRRLAYLFWAQALLLVVVLQPGLHGLGSQHYQAVGTSVEDWGRFAGGSALRLIGWPVAVKIEPGSWPAQCLAAWLQLAILAWLCACLWDYGRVRLQQWRSDSGPPKHWLVRLHLAGGLVIAAGGVFLMWLDAKQWHDVSGSLLPCGLLLTVAGAIVAGWSAKKWREDPLPLVELPTAGLPPGKPAARKRQDRAPSPLDFALDWNADARKLRWWLPDLLNRGREYLVPTREMPAGEEWHERRDQHAWADSLALHYQDLAVGALKRLLALVFIGACFYVLAQTPGVSTYVKQNLYFAYGLTIVVGVVCCWLGQSFEQRFVNYRMLAEALRIQFFFRWIGLPDQLRLHYPRRRLIEVDAVCHAAEQLDQRARQAGGCPSVNLSDALPLARKQWLDNQVEFFDNARKKRGHQLTTWHDRPQRQPR